MQQRWETNAMQCFATSCAVLLVSVLGAGWAAPLYAQDEIARGRALVINHGCGDCHGGVDNPASSHWLSGMRSPEQEFTSA